MKIIGKNIGMFSSKFSAMFASLRTKTVKKEEKFKLKETSL